MYLAIDPGADSGWAVFDRAGRLVRCGLGEPEYPATGVDRVLIEKPQAYPHGKKRIDPNDLITLAIRVGEQKSTAERTGARVDLVLPHAWKGSMSKEQCHAQMMPHLLPEERIVVGRALPPLPEGKRHNVLDAVALGVWARRDGPWRALVSM